MAGWFEAVRAECSRPTWSRGVDLVRAERVSIERTDGDEVVLRVTNPDGLLTPTVTLDLGEAAWDCDCPGAEDPCEHVAAAAIALRRAGQEGRELRAAGDSGHVRYCLLREGGGLAFERRVVQGQRETRVDASLKAIASGRAPGPRFLATESDLAVERVLAAAGLLQGRVRISRTALSRLLPALVGCDDVRLDGTPVEISTEPVTPHCHLRDDGDGFRLSVERDPSISETFEVGVALCGKALRPLRESRLSGREREDLPRGRYYPPERALELATEVIPDLHRRIPVEVHTRRLPRTGRVEPPWVLLEARRAGDALVVRADLVYGEPPRARIENGRLVHLRGSVPVRDETAERRLARAVQGRLELPLGREITARDSEAIALAERVGSWSGEIRGSGHRDFFRLPGLRARTQLSAQGFQVDFEVAADDGDAAAGSRAGQRVAAAAVLRAWDAGDSWVPLSGGGFAPLPTDWLERFGRATQSLLEARSAEGALPVSAIPDLARLCQALGEPPPPELEPLRALLEDFDRIPEATLPNDLTGTLRHYQRAGVDWLCFLRGAGLGGLLADDMGLGKTLQVLCALQGRSLVVAPTSVLHNWGEEIRRFRPGLSTCVYHGPQRALDASADVTLTTYAILRLDAERLGALDWDVVVLDEAQAIKNPDSQVARAANGLRGGWRVTLTGTPVENRLEELWSQLHFGNPGLMGSRAHFDERYAKRIAAGEPGVAEELRARIRPFVLRRLKRDVAPELPPRTEMVLHCELSEPERRIYEAVRAATRRDVVAQLQRGGNVLAALEALLRLRQAACHSGLVPGQRAEGSAKVRLLLEELDTVVADGHKALVFSQWTSLLDLVEPHLRAGGIDFTRLDGSTRDRGAVVATFQGESGPPVLLISLRAGGTGLNLTEADHVFLLDPWWNPAVEDQAADRTHRIGQTRPVMVYRLVAEDTVEERILALQVHKRSLADAALGGAQPTVALTRDDLLALLDDERLDD
jgi:superfamily II DNA or RNA helicase